MPNQRDRAWSAALEVAAKRGFFKINHVLRRFDDDGPSRATVNRVLMAMTDLGWLKHKTNSPYYQRGPKWAD